ncbi:hypothetical protein D9M72_559590 [compost metagenome]
MPQPQHSQQQQRQRSPQEEHHGAGQMHGKPSGVFGHHPHDDCPGSRGEGKDLGREGGEPRDTVAGTESEPDTGPGRHAQKCRAEQQRPHQHAQALDHERGIHHRVQR